MFKKIINNQSGISLVEVMVAAGISSVIALSTMKISTNSQKAMRKASRDADVNSFFNITLRGAFSNNDSCKASLGPILDGITPGGVVSTGSGNFSQIIIGDYALVNGASLPGYGDEFSISGMSISRSSTAQTCKLGVSLVRTNTEKKLGARSFTKYIDLACGFDSGTGDLQYCSSTESADGGNSPWKRSGDGSHTYLGDEFDGAIVGPESGTPPNAKLTISRADGSYPYSGDLVNGISMRNNNILRWSNDPLALSGGVSIAGNQGSECITLYSNNGTNDRTLEVCASGINAKENVLIDEGSSLTVSGDTTLSGNLSVANGATIENGVNVNSGTLDVANNAGIGGQLTVDGLADLNGNLVVSGTSTLDGTVNTGNTLTTGNKLTVQGGGAEISGDTIINGRLSVNGPADVDGLLSDGDVEINSSNSLKVNKILGLGNTLGVGKNDGSAAFTVAVGGTMKSNYIKSNGITAWDAGSASFFQGEVYMSKSLSIGQNLNVGGSVTVNSTLVHSDRRLKKEIKTTDLGLEFINSLKPVRYVYKNDKSDNPMYRIGLIAQDIQESIKKHSKDLKDKKSEFVVKNEKTGFFAVSYQSFISPLINAVKELFSINEKQDQEIAQLKAENEMLKSALCSKHNNEFKFCDSRGLASEKK